MSLFNELKRRNVIRVSMAYLAGAWLILQVADTVIPYFGLGDTFGRVLLIVAAIGFVPAVIAAWLFEWTPDGFRFDDEVEVDAAGAVVVRRRLDRIIIAVLALALVFFAIDEFLFDVNQSDSHYGDRSIAVLPFEDVSPDGDQAYLGNGIADELRLELQHLEGLRVAGRTSSNAYAQEGSKTIGEALNVESILEGSVRKDGDRIRITVQLTNVSDGFSIWSQSYNGGLEGIFEMQEEIAAQVAGSLGVSLGVGGVNAFHGAGTRSIEAYDLYLQARGRWHLYRNREEAVALLEQALEADPDYAVAWSELSIMVLNEAWGADEDEVPVIAEQAYQLASRAVELDPESAGVKSGLGLIKMYQYDWIGSEEDNAKAIELLADRLTIERYAFMLMRSGRIAEAEKQLYAAVAEEPMDGRPHPQIWHVQMAQGRIEEAQETRNYRQGSDLYADNLDIAFNKRDPEALEAAIRAMPETDVAFVAFYAPLLESSDSPDQVKSILREVYRDESKHWPRKLHDIAMAAAFFGDLDLALEVKSREVLVSPTRLASTWEPIMSEVRRLDGFKDLVSELNLVEYWRAYGWSDFCRPLGDEEFECS
jgi:TolB-like protein/tetratricopeptide (TPR) repeat protein